MEEPALAVGPCSGCALICLGCYRELDESSLFEYIHAARHIPAGAVIMEEPALAVGPCSGCALICLGCYRELDESSLFELTCGATHSRRCSDHGGAGAGRRALQRLCAHLCGGCKWPLCSASCPGQGKYTGHSTQECLLLKKWDPAKWEALTAMESHNEIRRARGDIWPMNERLVVQRMRKWKLEYDDEEIHTVCGILEVRFGANARALYDRAYLLAHDCTPSTTHTDAEALPGRPLVIRASFDQIDANDVPGFESFLHKYRNVVVPGHYLCLSAKHSLSQLYGKVPLYMIHEMTERQLHRKIEICRDLMKPAQSSEGLMASAAREALDKIKTWEQIIGKIS
ncbi:Uncharacterized protein OBRU01_18716 [Operophtera brumata]|uniref:Uncharacterized protein n=1 Tax=Operophtera brumata TaxID=104452 RepID=A0A0L7KYF7_OPEBR|nr:Uncharacterized protein OBRU01_18716 [Operophtera brumata]